MAQSYSFNAGLWIYPGENAWHFVTLPHYIADEIKLITSQPKRGFGSVRVDVQIGVSRWQTSIFPDSKAGSYLLPVKKDIRAKNNLQSGDLVTVQCVILDVEP